MTKLFSQVIIAGCLLSSLSCLADVELNRCLEVNKNSSDRFSICYGQLNQRTLMQKATDRNNRLEQQATEDQRKDEEAKAAGKILVNSIEDEKAAKSAGQIKDAPTEQQSDSSTTEPNNAESPPTIASPEITPSPTKDSAKKPQPEPASKPEKPNYPIQYY